MKAKATAPLLAPGEAERERAGRGTAGPNPRHFPKVKAPRSTFRAGCEAAPAQRPLLLAGLLLAACAPQADTPAAYRALDCAQAFQTQVAALIAQPDLTPAPKDPAEPYRFYSSTDGRTSYLITAKGAPGHPAIMMQRALGGDVITTGCPYGSAKGYDQLHAYLDSLKTWTRKK